MTSELAPMTLKLVYPALAMILWIFVVLGIVFLRRQAAFASKEVRLSDVAVSTERYPEPGPSGGGEFLEPVRNAGDLLRAHHAGDGGFGATAMRWRPSPGPSSRPASSTP
jgi:hypothetical protein